MAKPMQALSAKRPPGFKACPHCHREFGSRSLEIHMSKCSEAAEPPPPPQQQQQLKMPSSNRRRRNSSEFDDENAENHNENELNHSWPRRDLQVRLRTRTRRTADMNVLRPQTAILKRPAVLDESLKDKLDMTLTKKNFLAAVKLCSDLAVQRGLPNMRSRKGAPAGYKKDPYQGFRRVRRRSHDPDAPEAAAGANRQGSPSRESLSTRARYQADRASRLAAEVPPQPLQPANPALRMRARRRPMVTPAHTTERVPAPCNSCGRSDLPERFHTHPPLEAAGHQMPHAEGSRIPIRLAPPPKRMASLEERQKTEDTDDERGRRRNRDRLVKGHSKSVSPRKSPEKERLAVSPRKKRTGKLRQRDRLEDSSSEEGIVRKQKSVDKASPDDSDNQISSCSNASGGSTGSTVNTKKSTQVKCEICGKHFGQVSIKFHEPQCLRKQQAIKEREEKRLEELKKSENYYYEPEKEETPYDDTFNAIWEAHVQQLVPCEACGRTFFPDRIDVHKRWCKGGPTGKNVANGRQQDDQSHPGVAVVHSSTGRNATIPRQQDDQSHPGPVVVHSSTGRNAANSRQHEDQPSHSGPVVVHSSRLARQRQTHHQLVESDDDNNMGKPASPSRRDNSLFVSSLSPRKAASPSRSLEDLIATVDRDGSKDNSNQVLGERFKNKLMLHAEDLE